METHPEDAIPMGPDEVGDLSAGQTGSAPGPNLAGARPEPPPGSGPEPIFSTTPVTGFDPALLTTEPDWGSATNETPTTELTKAEVQTLQLQRIREYQVRSLRKSNPSKALMGSMNAGLMRLSVPMQEGLEAYLMAAPLTPERYHKVAALLDVQLRLARQIQRGEQQQEMLSRRGAKTPRRPVSQPTPRQLPR